MINNNNKVYSNELFSTRVNEVSTIKHILKDVYYVNDSAFAILKLSQCFIIGLCYKNYAISIRY